MNTSYRRSQSGIATILIILVVGIAVSVSVLGAMHLLKSTQQRNLSLHAGIGAQATSWQGVELVRRFLIQVEQEKLASWAASANKIPITIGDNSRMRGSIENVEELSRGTNSEGKTVYSYRITANVSGTGQVGSSAQSSSTVQVVYVVEAIKQESTPTTPTPPISNSALNVFNIYRDLNMTGGIKVIGGTTANFNVQGNVNLNSASIDGINSINSTGNVDIGSGIKVNNVYANGDVSLTGSASVSQIKNRGNVTISGGTSSLSIQTNGIATFKGGNASSVDAIGGVVVSAGGVNLSSVRTEGVLDWVGTGGGVSSAQANGNINYAGGNRNPTTLSSGGTITISGGGATKVVAAKNINLPSYGSINEAYAGQNINVSSSGNITTAKLKGNASLSSSGTINNILGQGNLYVANYQGVSGKIGGTLTKAQQWNSSVNVSVVPGLIVDVEAPVVVDLAEVPLVSVPPKQVIDVYPLESSANYVFKYINGAIQVSVNGVSGIPTGTYVFGNKYSNYNTYPQYLCKPENMAGTTCLQPVATICEGFSEQNSCFSYSNGKWTVNGKSMARGIVWFQGNLEVGNGFYVNTWLATGNINTAGGHQTMSPNYAGYAVTCKNAVPRGSSLGINPNFNNLVPTNFCDISTQKMITNGLGNSAFIAGGYNPTTGAYEGGVITLGASTVASGNVVGADLINTGGSTTIKGTVVAGGQNTANLSPMQLSGSTTLDLSGGSENYDPSVVPCMKNCNPVTPDPTEEVENKSSVLWTRYL